MTRSIVVTSILMGLGLMAGGCGNGMSQTLANQLTTVTNQAIQLRNERDAARADLALAKAGEAEAAEAFYATDAECASLELQLKKAKKDLGVTNMAVGMMAAARKKVNAELKKAKADLGELQATNKDLVKLNESLRARSDKVDGEISTLNETIRKLNEKIKALEAKLATTTE